MRPDAVIPQCGRAGCVPDGGVRQAAGGGWLEEPVLTEDPAKSPDASNSILTR